MAIALKVSEARVRLRRLDRMLRAINGNGAWVFPALQFETTPKRGGPYKQIRGLDRVFAALPPIYTRLPSHDSCARPTPTSPFVGAPFGRSRGCAAAVTWRSCCGLSTPPIGPAGDS